MEPHLTGLSRQTASRQVGSWIGTLFLYQPPRLGFSRSEQRLLWAALHGGTDEELSDTLCIVGREEDVARDLHPGDQSHASTNSKSATRVRTGIDSGSRQREKTSARSLLAGTSRGAAPSLAQAATSVVSHAQRSPQPKIEGVTSEWISSGHVMKRGNS